MLQRADLDIGCFAQSLGLDVEDLILVLNQPVASKIRRELPDTEEARRWDFRRRHTL